MVGAERGEGEKGRGGEEAKREGEGRKEVIMSACKTNPNKDEIVPKVGCTYLLGAIYLWPILQKTKNDLKERERNTHTS